MSEKKNNALSILSLVLGIVGLIAVVIVIGIVPCIVALTLGIIAIAKKQNVGMAVGGIVTSSIGIVIFMIILLSPSSPSSGTVTKNSANSDAIEVETESPDSSQTLADMVDTELYYFEGMGDTYAFVVAINNSNVTVDVDANLTANGSDGSTISTSSSNIYGIAPGSSYPLWNYFDGISVNDIDNIDYSMTVTRSSAISVTDMMDCSVEATNSDGVIVKATNIGSEDIDYPEVFAIFFQNGNPVGFGNIFLDNVSSDCVLQAGQTVTKTIECYSDGSFDDVKVYYHATKR